MTETQNALLYDHLKDYFRGHRAALDEMLAIVNGDTVISLRILDWFVTNYAKKYYTVYDLPTIDGEHMERFKVYRDYKLKLKAYSKKRFDPFCRWERQWVPVDDTKEMETTLGQLNFFKWAIEHGVIDYIRAHFDAIEQDMNAHNKGSKSLSSTLSSSVSLSSTMSSTMSSTYTDESETPQKPVNRTRKRRQELSPSACKSIKSELVHVVVRFS